MNVDAQFQPAAFAGTPHRPAQGPSEQTTSRPVDRPHHNEAAGKQSRHDSEPAAERKPADQQGAAEKNPTRETEPGPEDKSGLAAARPSSQDAAVTAGTGRPEAEVRAEASGPEESTSSATTTAPARGGFDTNPTQPASVGELLDVLA